MLYREPSTIIATVPSLPSFATYNFTITTLGAYSARIENATGGASTYIGVNILQSLQSTPSPSLTQQ